MTGDLTPIEFTWVLAGLFTLFGLICAGILQTNMEIVCFLFEICLGLPVKSNSLIVEMFFMLLGANRVLFWSGRSLHFNQPSTDCFSAWRIATNLEK